MKSVRDLDHSSRQAGARYLALAVLGSLLTAPVLNGTDREPER